MAAASGFEGSRFTDGDLNAGGGPTGIPGGTGSPPALDEAAGAGTGAGAVDPELPGGVGMAAVGAGIPPAAGGGGVAPPTAFLPRRALRSIFGFFSSAIEPPREDARRLRGDVEPMETRVLQGNYAPPYCFPPNFATSLGVSTLSEITNGKAHP